MSTSTPIRPERRLKRRAKKVHYCYWCGEIISPGDFYVVLEFMRVSTLELKFHPECYKAAQQSSAVLRGEQRKYEQLRGATVEESLYERQVEEEHRHDR